MTVRFYAFGVRIPAYRQQKARYREGNGLLSLNGAPSGMSACGWRRPLSLRRSAPCVLRWKTLTRFLSSAPLRVRIPPLAHKKAPWAVMGLGRSVLMAGTEGFEPPTAGTKNRSSTVELRPNVWCCPKATRLVYLIWEGIANAVE